MKRSYKVEMRNPLELLEHPRNRDFFDDITGEKWKAFVEDVEARGICSPITITQNDVIIDGHQRWRAAKELGLKKIPVMCRYYASEDDEILDLVQQNIQQRFSATQSAEKTNRCLNELERILGIGRYRSAGAVKPEDVPVGDKPDASGPVVFSREASVYNDVGGIGDLARVLGISKRHYMHLRTWDSLDETILSEMEDGRLSETTALKVMTRLSKQGQRELVQTFGSDLLSQFTRQELLAMVPELARADRARMEAEKQLAELMLDDGGPVVPRVQSIEVENELERNYEMLKMEYRKVLDRAADEKRARIREKEEASAHSSDLEREIVELKEGGVCVARIDHLMCDLRELRGMSSEAFLAQGERTRELIATLYATVRFLTRIVGEEEPKKSV